MMPNHITVDVEPLHSQRLVILSVLFGYLAVLIVGALAVSARRLLWHDELFTYYIATLPSFSQVWSALSTGTDGMPPAYYAIVRGSLWIFGNNNIALRLPGLIGFLLLAVALFNFVSLRLSPIYGAITALFPMVTGAQYYVHEARPYGLELGFAALALLCWQRATERRNRFIALGGLWFSLAVAISCHYYGVLLILPLAMGEVVRSIGRRRIDFAIWACFATSVLPLLFVLQLVLEAAKLAGTFWAPPRWGEAARFYIDLLAISVPPLIASLAIAIVAPRFMTFGREGLPAVQPNFPDHELGAIFGFLALPICGVLLAEFVTKAFTARYVLSGVIGISVLFAQAMHKLLAGRFQIAMGIALLLLAYFVALEWRELTIADNERSDFEKSIALLRSANKEDLPIVIGEPQTFVLFAHYAPSDIRSHLVYLANTALASEILGFSSSEEGMVQLVGPWFHMRVVPFEPFLASNHRFLLYGPWSGNWVNRVLSDQLFRIEFLARLESPTSNDKYLFYVTRDSKE